jgi:hypothetical protein
LHRVRSTLGCQLALLRQLRHTEPVKRRCAQAQRCGGLGQCPIA